MLGGGGFCDQRERRHMQDTHAHVKSTHFPRNPDPAKGNGLWYHTGEASKEEKVTWTNRYYERESEVVFFSPTTPPPLFLPTTTTITTVTSITTHYRRSVFAECDVQCTRTMHESRTYGAGTLLAGAVAAAAATALHNTP